MSQGSVSPWSRRAGRARLITALTLVIALVIPAAAAAASVSQPSPQGAGKVEAQVREQVDADGEATFWVRLGGRPDLSAATGIADWAERGQFVYDALNEFAESSQAEVAAHARRRLGAEYTAVLDHQRHPGDRRRRRGRRHGGQPRGQRHHRAQDLRRSPSRSRAPTHGINVIEWGIDAHQRPRCLGRVRGPRRGHRRRQHRHRRPVRPSRPGRPVPRQQRRRHLRPQLQLVRPVQVCGSPSLEPCDNNGHGTHTMGTMVGDDGGGNQIGVAPGARWIAAKGCETNSCSDVALLSSAEWISPRPTSTARTPARDLRPHIVNNSWGGGPGDPLVPRHASTPGSRPGSSRSSPTATPARPAAPPALPATTRRATRPAPSTSTTTSPASPAAAPRPSAGRQARHRRPRRERPQQRPRRRLRQLQRHLDGLAPRRRHGRPDVVGRAGAPRRHRRHPGDPRHDCATTPRTCSAAAPPTTTTSGARASSTPCAAVEQSPRGDTGTLTGTVTDAATGDPIAGATVTADRPDRPHRHHRRERLLHACCSSPAPTRSRSRRTGMRPRRPPSSSPRAPRPRSTSPSTRCRSTVITGTVTDGSGHGWPLYARHRHRRLSRRPGLHRPGHRRVQRRAAGVDHVHVQRHRGQRRLRDREPAVTVPPDSATQDFTLDRRPGQLHRARL